MYDYSIALGRVTGVEKDVIFTPRSWRADGSRRAVLYLHNLGATGTTPLDTANAPGTAALIAYLARHTLVITADLGGVGTCGNQTVQDAMDLAFALAVARGAKADKFCWLGVSMGGWAGLNYSRNKPGNVAAGVGIIPGTDLADVRNFNRPAGWTGTTQNAPQNTATVNAAWGLGANSTGDYPTHGGSLAALPAGANPAANTVPAVPLRAWYATDDTTMLPSTVTGYWPTATAISAPAGHTEASIQAVPPMDVFSFLAPYVA